MAKDQNNHDRDVDVNIDQSLGLDIDQDMSIDVATTKTTKTETVEKVYIDENVDVDVYENVHVHKDVDVKEDVYVKKDVDIDENVYVDVDINENRTTTDTTNINLNERVYKDIDIDIDETVSKDIDIDIWDVHVDVHADNIIQSATLDDDVNDIDNARLIDVTAYANLEMQDFMSDQLAIGKSFNGAGNDMQFDVNQSNNLDDNDQVHGTTATYQNHQAPNVDGSLDASHTSWWSAEHGKGGGDKPDKPGTGGYDEAGQPKVGKPDYGMANGGKPTWSAEGGASGSLVINLDLTAPETAFQTATADGGEATAGDGVTKADVKDADGDVDGSTIATADAAATAEAFANQIMAGGNQQANFATLDVVGGNLKDVGDIGGGDHGGNGGHGPYQTASNPPYGDDDDGGEHGHGKIDGLAIRDSLLDEDINDLDSHELINVADMGMVTMEDFTLDVTAIGQSFNGAGNDMQFDVNQANDLVDNDLVTGTTASYVGSGWNGPFQDVSAYGGTSAAGNGIGDIKSDATGGISGSAAATADALASAEAFTNSIVVGANLQLNNFSATVVGGDSFLADDIGS